MTKRDVERLLAVYDTDPIGALTRALATVVDADPDLGFDHLVRSARLASPRTALLLARDQRSLDDLAQELNECRGLP